MVGVKRLSQLLQEIDFLTLVHYKKHFVDDVQHLRQLNNSFQRYLVCKFHHDLHEKHQLFGSRFEN